MVRDPLYPVEQREVDGAITCWTTTGKAVFISDELLPLIAVA